VVVPEERSNVVKMHRYHRRLRNERPRRCAIEQRYGAENVGRWDDWDWSYVNGKLATLGWILGMEWDFLNI
jgi:hypothetical protein